MCLLVSGVVAWLTRRARGLPTSNMFKGGGIGALFGGKKPDDGGGAPSPGGGRGPRVAGIGALLGSPDTRRGSATPTGGARRAAPAPEIADGDMPALFARAQELLDKTNRRAELGSRTVRPRTVVRGCRTTVDAESSNSARSTRPDAQPHAPDRPTHRPRRPARDAQPEDDSRQFMRVNEIKRLVGRLRAAIPNLTDAGERDAWTAQLVFLEEDVASAVERVTGAAEPAAGPAPSLDSPNPTVPVAPGGGMFAGLDVSHPREPDPGPGPFAAFGRVSVGLGVSDGPLQRVGPHPFHADGLSSDRRRGGYRRRAPTADVIHPVRRRGPRRARRVHVRVFRSGV